MILHILRHGIAEDAKPGAADATRRLTPGGRTRMRAAARGLRALGLRIDVLLTSPLVRARETAEIVADVYGNLVPRELPALAAGEAPVDTLRALRPFARQEGVMVVGHEPGLSALASLLLAGGADTLAIALKKGGLVSLEVPDLGGRSHATLRWMLTPKQLRRLGR